MDVTLLGDPAVFAARTATWLATEPLTANVLAVQLAGVLDGSRSTMPGSVWAVVTGPGGDVVGAAMHTSPVGVFLPRLPPGAAAALAVSFADADRVPDGVSGERGAVGAFTRTWERLTGVRGRLSRQTRLHVLDLLVPPTGVPGAVRTAGPGDLDLVQAWFRDFTRDTDALSGGAVTAAETAEAASRKVAHREVRLWTVANRPVSLASVSPTAVGVARIGPVFTPSAQRGHGFAGAVTAAAAGDALTAGAAQIVLYTDLADPTAGRVYERIGFVPTFDAEQVRLTSAAL